MACCYPLSFCFHWADAAMCKQKTRSLPLKHQLLTPHREASDAEAITDELDQSELQDQDDTAQSSDAITGFRAEQVSSTSASLDAIPAYEGYAFVETITISHFLQMQTNREQMRLKITAN